MIRKKVLGVGVTSATMLVQDTEAGGALRVLKRINVSSWDTAEVMETHEMFKAISLASIPFMVELHSVVLQSSFLNLVSSYCTGNVLEEYMEEVLQVPLTEATALRWMLAIALAVEQLQKLKNCCFYGLSPDRVFVAANIPGGICAGLPMSRVSYFKWLSDRKALGVAVEREYPPEVVGSNKYHPRASDVWHLGLLGVKMLGVHTSYRHRSSEARALIAAMMETNVERRPGIASVVRALKELIDKDNAPRPDHEEVSPVSSARFATPLSPRTGQHATAPSANISDNYESGVLPDARRDEPREKQLPENQDGAIRSGRHRLPSSWHRRAMEQFEELQRLNASPPRGRSRGVLPGGQQSRSASAGANLVPVQSQRDAASPRTVSNLAKAQAQRRGRNVNNPPTWTAAGGGGNGGRSFTNISQYSSNQQVEQQRRRDMLKHDQEERKWRQQERDRLAQDVHRNHMDKMKTIRSKRGEETKNDIRKHIKQWKEQRNSTRDENVIVNEHAGVSVFVPKSGPPPPQQQQRQPSAAAMKNKESVIVLATKTRRSTAIASTNAITTKTTPLMALQRPVSAPSRTVSPPVCGPTRSTSVYHERGISPNVPQTRANFSARTSQAESARGNATLKSASSVQSNGVSGRLISNATANGAVGIPPPLLSATRNLEDLGPKKDTIERNKVNKVNGESGSGSAGLLASLELSISNLRGSLDTLLTDRSVYLEALDVVNAFLLRPEAERHNPRFNVVFMSTLRELLDDDNLFFAAGPLCAQMVALQGFLQASKASEKVTHPDKN